LSTSVTVLTWGAVITGLIGFAYSWFFLLKISGEKSLGWREWLSLLAVGFVSVAAFLRFLMPLFWSNDFGTQVHIAQTWTKVSVRICALGLLVCFIGRPRLILPIVVACFGTAVFWVMSTIP